MYNFFKENSILFINSIILLGLFVSVPNLNRINTSAEKEKINITPSTTNTTTNTDQNKKILGNDSTSLQESSKEITTPSIKNKTITQPKIKTQTIPPLKDREDDEEFDD